MPELLKDLPQYHFDRDEFVNAFYAVFDGKELDTLLECCIERLYRNDFLLYYAEDEYYIMHLPSGTIINWYKHLGRTNTCNRADFTLDDLHEFLTALKSKLVT